MYVQAATSTLAEMSPGTKFQPVLDDPFIKDRRETISVVLCTGKLYYDLAKEVAARGLEERVVLIRLEELCPFPFADLLRALQPLVAADAELVWVQEEPRNQGGWSHVRERLGTVLAGKEVKYRGRRESAVPATGVGKWHAEEHASLLEGAFEGL